MFWVFIHYRHIHPIYIISFWARLGWIVGLVAGGKHKEFEIAGFKVMPYTAGRRGPAIGVNLVERFLKIDSLTVTGAVQYWGWTKE